MPTFTLSLIPAALFAAACRDADQPEPPLLLGRPIATASLEILSGDGQTGFAGEFLRDALVVRVVTGGGEPARGIPVLFEVLAGGGSLADEHIQAPDGFSGPVVTVTDSLGAARIRWRLGRDLATGQALRARRYDPAGPLDSPVTFSARFTRPAEAPLGTTHGGPR